MGEVHDEFMQDLTVSRERYAGRPAGERTRLWLLREMNRFASWAFALAAGCTPKPGPLVASPAEAPSTRRDSRETEGSQPQPRSLVAVPGAGPVRTVPSLSDALPDELSAHADWACEIAVALEAVGARCEAEERTITPRFAKHVIYRLFATTCNESTCLRPEIALHGFTPRPPQPSNEWFKCISAGARALRFERPTRGEVRTLCAQRQLPEDFRGLYLKSPDPIPEDACVVGETSCWPAAPPAPR